MDTPTNHSMILGLDYELFFGSNSGTLEACLIRPTQDLINVMDRFGATLTLFVDIGYLVKLKALAHSNPHFIQAYDKIAKQLNQLSKAGHELQLHIHPHWEDARYSEGVWDFSNTRFRLQEFSPVEIEDICTRYKVALEEISEAQVFAFRAGGWCIQPFDNIGPIFKKLGIWLDSTVFKGGFSDVANRGFDFTSFPKKPYWRFSEQPTHEDNNGHMLEAPISNLPHTPWFFWKMLWVKKLARNRALHAPYGDGGAIPQSLSYYFERLTQITFGPASIDGIKASTLDQAFKYHKKTNADGYFNVMGHPKSLSQFSLQALGQFLTDNKDIQSIGLQDLQHLKP